MCWAHSSAWIEWLPAEQLVEGSSPSGPAKNKNVEKVDSMLTLLVRYHPNDCAELAAAILRASSGDAVPLYTCCIA